MEGRWDAGFITKARPLEHACRELRGVFIMEMYEAHMLDVLGQGHAPARIWSEASIIDKVYITRTVDKINRDCGGWYEGS